jgi:ADP-heptose:LPS heptosyltransferase
MTKNRNLFRLTRFILLKFPFLFNFLARFRRKQKDKRVLVIKTDAIGDYILFRNYMEVLRSSEKFKGYRIDLLGNSIWEDIAVSYDSSYIDNFYFTSPYKLYEEPINTLKLGWLLFKNNYQVVLQPSFTRLFITDGLAAFTAAEQIIGFETDTEGIPARYKKKTDKFYTQKIVLPAEIFFEFEKTKFFFQSILEQRIDLTMPSISVKSNRNDGIFVFPGAGSVKRGWEKEKFLDLIKLIIQHTNAPVYLAGGVNEIPIGDFLMQNLPNAAVHNLIGKTPLLKLIELIGSSGLVIANDTSAIHIAVATKTQSICILGGGHFERFAPYPIDFEHAPLCVFEKMECYNCNWVCVFKTEPDEPHPCVSNVNFEKVWNVTLPLLLKNNAQTV